MIDLAIDHSFAGAGWKQRTGAGTTITASGGVLTCTAPAGSAGLMDYYVPILPGQTVEVEVFARLLSGDARVALDLVNHNQGIFTTPEYVIVDAADWKRYRITYTVPHRANQGSFVRVTLGIFTTPAGSAQYLAPIIRTTGGIGAPLVVARGLLEVNLGVASLVTNRPHHGVASVVRTDAQTVTVTLDHQMPISPALVRPHLHINGTSEHAEIPVAGGLTGGDTPTFLVKWTNGATFADISTGDRFAFFEVTL